MESFPVKPSSKSPRQLKMVEWYRPSQLLRTAINVVISGIFGRHADFRLIEALETPDIRVQDYSDQGAEPFWIDYVADLGDGWNSTYAVAYYVSQTQWKLNDPDNHMHELKRGSILIFGGDAVYPFASRAQYEERLIQPYNAALSYTTPPHPDLYVTPGNHDWYDSLAAYTRLFCANRWFAGWKTKQERSYFALKLPHQWWLIGTDIQLDSDIDDSQVKFFKKIAEEMKENDKVILCTAEPEWIFAKLYGKSDPEYSENNLKFLEDSVFKKKIVVYITGDLHHYRRHENSAGVQKIIAGGGGAFLHPTHGDAVSTLLDGSILKKSFPDPDTSRKLCWRNFAFLFLNPSFGILTGFFYLLTVWTTKIDLSPFGMQDVGRVMSTIMNHALKTPLGFFWIIAVLLGFIFFTDTHSRFYRIIAGFIHGAFHLIAALLLGWVAIKMSVYLGFIFDSTAQLLLSGLFIFLGGWIIGSCLMGIYLFVSLNIFSRHSNEAFSSLAIQDWKNFLKLKIDTDGSLTIYPIGIRRVPRKWKTNSVDAIPAMVPDDARASEPQLIESPIKIKNRGTH